MTDLKEEISEILSFYGGDPALTNEDATDQLLTLIKKHEREVLEEVKKELTKGSEEGHYVYTHSDTFIAYLDSKIKELE